LVLEPLGRSGAGGEYGFGLESHPVLAVGLFNLSDFAEQSLHCELLLRDGPLPHPIPEDGKGRLVIEGGGAAFGYADNVVLFGWNAKGKRETG
jgi:hypothetical protein